MVSQDGVYLYEVSEQIQVSWTFSSHFVESISSAFQGLSEVQGY